jgi:hypothetical protein
MAQGARVAMSLMSADLRAACPLSKATEFVGMPRKLGKVLADNLDFGTHNYVPKKQREGDFCETSYYLDKAPGATTFSLWRRRDASPDDDVFGGGTREELVKGVRGLQFEYYDGFDWFDEWGDPNGKERKRSEDTQKPNATGLPEAVRITLIVGNSQTKPASDGLEAKEEDEEPPIVFRTVARLELAAALYQQSTSASGGNSGNSTSQSQNNTFSPEQMAPGGPQ